MRWNFSKSKKAFKSVRLLGRSIFPKKCCYCCDYVTLEPMWESKKQIRLNNNPNHIDTWYFCMFCAFSKSRVEELAFTKDIKLYCQLATNAGFMRPNEPAPEII